MTDLDLRILVIADNLLARTGLAALLGATPGLQVVGQTTGGDNLLAELDVFRPDAAVYDLGWSPQPGRLDALAGTGLPLVVLLPDEEHAPATAAALAALGDAEVPAVYGLLPREVEPHILAAALEAVAGGLVVLDPLLAAAVVPESAVTPAPTEELTPRERDVLQLMAEGLANKAIAQRLGISDHTVKFHVNAILGKLGAQSRTEAVVRATRLGLLIL